ncbi:MAG TPA: NAD(P)H-binding protein [Solirubrobacterales bacterium]|nr:NAD(P)H-binding protein [Solirubrobacterales bacterium]
MREQKRIAVTGATGRVGRHLVDVLADQGHEVVEISRSRGVDVITAEGLAEALDGVDAVIDTATSPTPEGAMEFFTTAGRNLQAYGAHAGVQRLVVVSIIGADRFPVGYNAAKVAQERIALEGSIPAGVLRAAQFHEFVEQLVDWGRQEDGSSQVPRMRTQLVSARAVAESLAKMATEDSPFRPDQPLAEIAGPREESLVEMARLLAERRGDPERVEETREADESTRELYESGALLPGPHAELAGPTYEAWLDSAFAASPSTNRSSSSSKRAS